MLADEPVSRPVAGNIFELCTASGAGIKDGWTGPALKAGCSNSDQKQSGMAAVFSDLFFATNSEARVDVEASCLLESKA